MTSRVTRSPRRAWLSAACCALVAVVAPHATVLAGRNAYFLKDTLLWFYPARSYLHARFADGAIPQWGGELGFGAPLLADPSMAVLYPLHALLLLPAPFCIGLFLWAHVALGAAGTFAWLSRARVSPVACAFGAASFALGGYVTSMLASGTHLLGLAWLPLVLTLVDRFVARPSPARLAAASGAWAMQLTAGEPQAVMVTGLLALLFLALGPRDAGHATRTRTSPFPSSVAWLALVVFAAVALAAVQLVPYVLLLARHRRGAGLALVEAQHWSLHPAHLVDLAFPGAFGDLNREGSFFAYALDDEHGPVNRWPWMVTPYVGATALALASVARCASGDRARRSVRFLGAAALVSLLLALGAHTPVFELWFRVVPGARAVRYPAKYFMVAAWALPCAAAFGVDALRARAPGARATLTAAAGLLAAAGAGVALFAGTLGADVLELDGEALVRAIESVRGAVVAGLTPLAVIVALAWVAGAARARAIGPEPTLRNLALVTLACVGVLDVAWNNGRALALCPVDIYTARPTWLTAGGDPSPRVAFALGDVDLAGPASPLARRDAAARMVEAGVPNTALLFGAAQVNNYTALMTESERAFWDVAERHPTSVLVTFGIDYLVRPLSDRRDVEGVAEVVRELPAAGLEVLRMRAPLPRVYFASTAIAADGLRDALRLLDDPRVRVGQAVVLETSATPERRGAAGRDPDAVRACAATPSSRDEIRGVCDVTAPGFFVASSTHDVGFAATVDGAPATILTANGGGMAVAIPAGRHEVRLVYETPGLPWGARTTVVAVVALAVAEALRRRKVAA